MIYLLAEMKYSNRATKELANGSAPDGHVTDYVIGCPYKTMNCTPLALRCTAEGVILTPGQGTLSCPSPLMVD